MINVLINFGKRTKYLDCTENKYPTIYTVKDINSVDELMDKFDDTIALVNSKGDDVNDMHLSDEDLSIAMDYFNANKENIPTFLSDLKKKNFIDNYLIIYNIKK